MQIRSIIHTIAARRSGGALMALSLTAAVVALPPSSALAGPKGPSIHPRVFATPPKGATKPDDVTRLDGVLYVSYQNNAGADGTPAGSKSTIAAFDLSNGNLLTTYSLPGRCDGLTADPLQGQILASVNEDNNSSLFVIRPGDPTPVHYTYSPNPAETGSDGTNGGTDAISVSPDGTIYVAHSNPDPTLPPPDNTAAAFTMTLAGTTARLTPLFGVNDVATIINPPKGSPKRAPLALTDPDSNRFVPSLDGGTLIQVAQADSKLALATHLNHNHPSMAEVRLTNATGPATTTPQLDDIAPVTGPGVLFMVDQKGGDIYSIDTQNIKRGTYFVSQPAPSTGDLPNTPAIAVVNLHTGLVTHLDTTLGSPKGLLFVPKKPTH